jgi:aspartate kinase
MDRSKINIDQVLELFKDTYSVKFNEGLTLITIRHYDQATIDRVTENKEIILEQKTRQTARIVVK